MMIIKPKNMADTMFVMNKNNAHLLVFILVLKYYCFLYKHQLCLCSYKSLKMAFNRAPDWIL